MNSMTINNRGSVIDSMTINNRGRVVNLMTTKKRGTRVTTGISRNRKNITEHSDDDDNSNERGNNHQGSQLWKEPRSQEWHHWDATGSTSLEWPQDRHHRSELSRWLNDNGQERKVCDDHDDSEALEPMRDYHRINTVSWHLTTAKKRGNKLDYRSGETMPLAGRGEKKKDVAEPQTANDNKRQWRRQLWKECQESASRKPNKRDEATRRQRRSTKDLHMPRKEVDGLDLMEKDKLEWSVLVTTLNQSTILE